ncbi:response regulator transcription factor [Paenibacillus sp. IB182496]|uniref:Response regulator transcription factor n=1 Tax=Paenibacillus sabuli TaxID=2772509 RepID=A0A927GRE0_9BACL|nr:response regulator transcription factor [Paenibacillus sabuli]MBD2845534.1 response regulator transcription factor [Paenibacillus sabuli]
MTARIVVADDESNITDVCRRYLEREGYAVWIAADGEQALRLWAAHRPHLLVLDLMMPRLGGLEVCSTVRGQADTPIIMLTARGEEADRLLGLTMGADDYLTKPFSPRELVLRVRNILRRAGHGGNVDAAQSYHRHPPLVGGSAYGGPGSQGAATGGEIDQCSAHAGAIVFDGLTIYPDERRVVVQGREAELTAKEFDLLQLLATYPGKVFSRNQLLSAIWDMAYDGDTTTVTVHVRRLREKVEPNPSDPTYIKTVWGIGYKLGTGGTPS